jgi:hypothetical protein
MLDCLNPLSFSSLPDLQALNGRPRRANELASGLLQELYGRKVPTSQALSWTKQQPSNRLVGDNLVYDLKIPYRFKAHKATS